MKRFHLYATPGAGRVDGPYLKVLPGDVLPYEKGRRTQHHYSLHYCSYNQSCLCRRHNSIKLYRHPALHDVDPSFRIRISQSRDRVGLLWLPWVYCQYQVQFLLVFPIFYRPSITILKAKPPHREHCLGFEYSCLLVSC